MKLIELLEKNKTNEGVWNVARGIGKAVGGTAKAVGNIGNEFVKGASGGKVDASKVKDYVSGARSKFDLYKKYKDKKRWSDKGKGRGIGKELDDDVRLRNIIRTEYNLENSNILPQEIYDLYSDALKTGNEAEVEKVIKRLSDYMKNKDLKPSNKKALKDLLSQA